MLYISLGSQPSVANALNSLKLNKSETLFDNLGNVSYEMLLNNLNNQFNNFFPKLDEIKVITGSVNIKNGIAYSLIEDKRNGTIFYDVLPLGKKINKLFGVARNRYEKLISSFNHTIQSSMSVVFIRQMYDDNENDTLELSNTLKWVYPACRFHLKHRYAGNEHTKCYNFWKSELSN
jgi:hypothetical protein